MGLLRFFGYDGSAYTVFRDAFAYLARGDPVKAWQVLRAKMSVFTMANYTTFFLLLATVAMSVWQARQNAKRQAAARPGLMEPAPGFPEVEPLDDFDWKTTEPLKIRPFKPKYHLTMDGNTALESLGPADLLLMDKNYKDRIELRRQLIKDRNDIVVGVNNDEAIRPAVYELYTYLFGTYLPGRYPTMFKLERADYESGKITFLHNNLTSELFPIRPSPTKPTSFWLELLGRTIDEDFLLLLPSKTAADEKDAADPRYFLEAYITCFPSGFNPRDKLGKQLRDIHGPVPGYEDKLAGSMDRFFANLEVGKYVKRANWTVTTGADLHAADGATHAYDADKTQGTIKQEEVDIEKTVLRTERQTLHRLPGSKALVFAFKTYTYPITQIKEEGMGEAMAEAIDGLKGGNVPGMHFYKRGAVWGESVKRFLRS